MQRLLAAASPPIQVATSELVMPVGRGVRALLAWDEDAPCWCAWGLRVRSGLEKAIPVHSHIMKPEVGYKATPPKATGETRVAQGEGEVVDGVRERVSRGQGLRASAALNKIRIFAAQKFSAQIRKMASHLF